MPPRPQAKSKEAPEEAPKEKRNELSDVKEAVRRIATGQVRTEEQLSEILELLK